MLPPGSSEVIFTTGVINGNVENIATVVAVSVVTADLGFPKSTHWITTQNPITNKGDDLAGAEDVTHPLLMNSLVSQRSRCQTRFMLATT
jgi:hypothetical protein